MPRDDRLLAEAVRLLGGVPDKSTFRHDLEINHEWIGATLNLLSQANDLALCVKSQTIADGMNDTPISVKDPRAQFVRLLHQVKRKFELNLGYSIPRNYIEPSEIDAEILTPKLKSFEEAVRSDNEIEPDDRETILAEIAVFEASLGCARLSTDLIVRFVNGVLKGAFIFSASSLTKKIGSDLAETICQAAKSIIS